MCERRHPPYMFKHTHISEITLNVGNYLYQTFECQSLFSLNELKLFFSLPCADDMPTHISA